MAESRLGKLAGRMKQEIEREDQRRKAADEQKAKADTERRDAESRIKKRQADAQRARRTLLSELFGFGQELGVVGAEQDDEGVTLSFRGRAVRFEIDGPEDRIALRVPGEVVPRNHHITRDGDAWEVVFDHGTVVNRHPPRGRPRGDPAQPAPGAAAGAGAPPSPRARPAARRGGRRAAARSRPARSSRS
jgi:hypothetical protein